LGVKFSILKKRSVNAPKEQDGMDLDVQLLLYVLMVDNIMFLVSYVNALIIVSGMEHFV